MSIEEQARTRVLYLILVGTTIFANSCGTRTEAHKKGESFIETKVRNCSGSAFTLSTSRLGGGRTSLIEMKDFDWSIKKGEVSDADRLNGKEFTGYIIFKYSSARARPTEGGEKCWSAWRSGDVYYAIDFLFLDPVKIENVNGSWKIGGETFMVINRPEEYQAPSDCTAAEQEYETCPAQ